MIRLLEHFFKVSEDVVDEYALFVLFSKHYKASRSRGYFYRHLYQFVSIPPSAVPSGPPRWRAVFLFSRAPFRANTSFAPPGM